MDPEAMELGDSIITLPDGARYSACMMTLEEVARTMKRREASEQPLSGRYLSMPDLIIIKNKGASEMVDVVRDIVTSGNIAKQLPRIREDDELDVPMM